MRGIDVRKNQNAKIFSQRSDYFRSNMKMMFWEFFMIKLRGSEVDNFLKF